MCEMSMRFVGIQITTNCVQSRHTWQIVSPLAPRFSTSVRPSFPLPELSRHQGVIGSSSNLQHLSGQHATRLCIEISRTALGPCLSLGVFQRNHQRIRHNLGEKKEVDRLTKAGPNLEIFSKNMQKLKNEHMSKSQKQKTLEN